MLWVGSSVSINRTSRAEQMCLADLVGYFRLAAAGQQQTNTRNLTLERSVSYNFSLWLVAVNVNGSNTYTRTSAGVATPLWSSTANHLSQKLSFLFTRAILTCSQWIIVLRSPFSYAKNSHNSVSTCLTATVRLIFFETRREHKKGCKIVSLCLLCAKRLHYSHLRSSITSCAAFSTLEPRIIAVQ